MYKEKAQESMNDGQYSKAINFYTLAIKNEPTDSKLYSSRAKAYYLNIQTLEDPTLQQWKKVIHDCSSALNLNKENYDAMFYNGLTQVYGYKKFEKALKMLHQAYEKSLIKSRNSKSFALPQQIYLEILKIKKIKNNHDIEEKIIKSNPFFIKLVHLLQKNYDSEFQKLASKNLESDSFKILSTKLAIKYNEEIKTLIELFELKFKKDDESSSSKSNDPPDYLCDPISFNLFFEPIITPSGQSFEKSWLLQHLSNNEFDPLTRQKLAKDQCYPNLGLESCVDQYIQSNNNNGT
ncbi:unnamed protein product [Candida verbasci]|uniref:RING-type E3 ubiquitin transferase n=1 Tax=Candida verbasci TaxID=1227364 RepID=A0A9W4XCD6_9ASCO|nr:unnamed protein product [Candida verbasci]